MCGEFDKVFNFSFSSIIFDYEQQTSKKMDEEKVGAGGKAEREKK